MNQTTINIEEIAPYMDERPITEEILEEREFEKVEVTAEESGGKWFTYYTYDFFPDKPYNDLSLISNKDEDGNLIVKLFPYEYPVFKTAGGIAMIQMSLQGE
ncbi:hypothetical protein H8D85_02445 [bacterium]|nr:hypothetical protein [bacterium]